MAIRHRVLNDYKHVIGIIEGMHIVLHADFKDSRDHTGVPHPEQGGMFQSQRSSAEREIPHNEYTIPFLLYAYDVKRTTFQRR